MRKIYTLHLFLLLSLLFFFQQVSFSQKTFSTHSEIKELGKSKVLLEKIIVDKEYSYSQINTSIYVSYKSGSLKKFWSNIAIATAGITVGGFHVLNTKDKELKATNKVSELTPFGVSLTALPFIFKNRPKRTPNVNLELHYKKNDKTEIEIWTQPISKEARNNFELLNINITKPLYEGIIEVYLINNSRDNIYYIGNNTSKMVYKPDSLNTQKKNELNFEDSTVYTTTPKSNSIDIFSSSEFIIPIIKQKNEQNIFEKLENFNEYTISKKIGVSNSKKAEFKSSKAEIVSGMGNEFNLLVQECIDTYQRYCYGNDCTSWELIESSCIIKDDGTSYSYGGGGSSDSNSGQGGEGNIDNNPAIRRQCQKCKDYADNEFTSKMNNQKYLISTGIVACLGAGVMAGVSVYTKTAIIELLSGFTAGTASALHGILALAAGLGTSGFCIAGLIFNYYQEEDSAKNSLYKDYRDCNSEYGCKF